MEMGDHAALADEVDYLRKLFPNNAMYHFVHATASWLDRLELESDCAEFLVATSYCRRFFPCWLLPRIAGLYAGAVSGLGRDEALADMDRCLALEPEASFAYACRAIFHAHAGHFLPTCRDLALFVLTFDRRQYHPYVTIDRVNRRFLIGCYVTGPDRGASAQRRGPVADIGGRCLNLAFQRLVAATFGAEP